MLNSATAKSTMFAGRTYQQWQLATYNDATPLEDQPREQVIARLSRFFLQLRTVNGQRYKRGSYITIVNSLQRLLNAAIERRFRQDGQPEKRYHFNQDDDCGQLRDNANKALKESVYFCCCGRGSVVFQRLARLRLPCTVAPRRVRLRSPCTALHGNARLARS